MFELLNTIKRNSNEFKLESEQIFAKHEDSKSRVTTLHKTRKKILTLSIQQDELFQQAIECIERGIYRAALVMGWAAFMDFLEQKIASDGLVKAKIQRNNWVRYNTIEEIRENATEHELISVARDLGLLTKGEMKTLHGHLSTRNQCAHPSNHRPDMNESLGYIAALLNLISQLQNKAL